MATILYSHQPKHINKRYKILYYNDYKIKYVSNKLLILIQILKSHSII